jgi:hypothetical protein
MARKRTRAVEPIGHPTTDWEWFAPSDQPYSHPSLGYVSLNIFLTVGIYSLRLGGGDLGAYGEPRQIHRHRLQRAKACTNMMKGEPREPL